MKYAGSTDAEDDIDEKLREGLLQSLDDLVATRAANVLNEDLEVEERAPVDKVENALRKADEASALVLDGEVDNSLISMVEAYDVEYLGGMSRSDTASSSDLEILTREELAEVISSQ